MKKYLLAALMSPLISHGQSIGISVYDLISDAPLPYANIYFIHSGIGSSANQYGQTAFLSSDLLTTDSFVVSYIGYDKQTFAFSKATYKEPYIIKLAPSQHLLSEIVIHSENQQDPKKIIKQAIKNTTANYTSDPTLYYTLYRETVAENNRFIQLNEAILLTHYTGYPQKKLDPDLWKAYYYDDAYAFYLDGNRFFHPLLNDLNTANDKQSIIATRHSDNWSDHGIETTLIGDPLLLFALDKIKYQYDFFNPSILHKYQFNNEPDEYIDSAECYVISFYPKETEKHFVIDQSKKNRSAIYAGRLYITKNTFALVGFEYVLVAERDFGFFNSSMPLEYRVKMEYQESNGKYHIRYICQTETRKVDTNQKGESILHNAKREIYVLDTATIHVQDPDSLARFKTTRYSSVRHFPDNYDPDYWKNLPNEEPFRLPHDLKADLELKMPLDSQFASYKSEFRKDLPAPCPDTDHYSFYYHGDTITDSLQWMALPSFDSRFRNYLEAENRYAKNVISEDKNYQKKLFDKLNSFYKDQPEKVRINKAGTYFLTEDSLSHEILCYQIDSGTYREVLDLTQLMEKQENNFLKQVLPDPTNNFILALLETHGTPGSLAYAFSSGSSNPSDSISGVYTIQWFTDSTILYTQTNEAGSSRELHFRNIRNKKDVVIYREKDPKFDVEVSRSNKELFLTVQSKTENEIYLIKPGQEEPVLQLIHGREEGILAKAKDQNGIYLLVQDTPNRSSIKFATLQDPSAQFVYGRSQKGEFIYDFLPVSHGIVALVYDHSIPMLKYYEPENEKWNTIDFNSAIGYYQLLSYDSTANSFRFYFSSPSHPPAAYEYHFETDELKIDSEPTNIDPIYYSYTSTKRIWVKSFDNTMIPVTIVQNRLHGKSHAGLILKAYGAYGALTIPDFSAADAILLEQGYTIAYAHVRGESVLGPSWYQAGRGMQKKNSVEDYIACAEYLIDKEYTTPQKLIGYGNSAGGIVVGQAMNLKPYLFNSVILDHPYLDVINTMMNDSLPLTLDEYKEWGDPNSKEVYDYILSYSPYQNITKQYYPNVLLIASYLDYQTPAWQIAKFAARLRQQNLSDSKILLLTDMTSGHKGSTTGKEWVKLYAETYTFIKLMCRQ